MENKDRSGILMMANYKNVIPYSRLRELVRFYVVMCSHAFMFVNEKAIESVVTEIIYLSTTSKEITIEEVTKIIHKWNQESGK